MIVVLFAGGFIAIGSDSTMIRNGTAHELFVRPRCGGPSREDAAPAFRSMNSIPWVETVDISNAMAFLCSDEARYITGESLAVAAGTNATNAG